MPSEIALLVYYQYMFTRRLDLSSNSIIQDVMSSSLFRNDVYMFMRRLDLPSNSIIQDVMSSSLFRNYVYYVYEKA